LRGQHRRNGAAIPAEQWQGLGDGGVLDAASRNGDSYASRRTLEIQRLIGRSLRTVVDMQALGERTIMLDCDVIQADGGTRTASITGAYVALLIAVRKLMQFGALKRNPIVDAVAATSVGLVDGTPLLDLNYEEDSRASVDMNIVMTGAGKFVELQATGERAAFDDSELAALVELGRAGVKDLLAMQSAVLQRS
jgi:ribonuclease PH